LGGKEEGGKKKNPNKKRKVYSYTSLFYSDDSAVEVMMRRKETKIVEMSSRSEQPGKNRQKQIRVNNKIQKIRNRST
jgi:hypothetical protein